MKRAKAATSLGNCNRLRTDLHGEFDATSEAMQMVTEEDAFLMQQASQPVDPAAGSHSPRSEAGTVSGEMAKLSLTSPSQSGPGEDETQQ